LVPGHRADLVAWPGDPVQHDPTGWSPVLVLTGGRRHGL
jgi:imidazolonepropionase-like amidohydrolase